MNDANSKGLFNSVRQLFGTGLELLQVRLELLGTELEVEKRRLFDSVLLTIAAMIFLGIGLLCFCTLIIVLLWESYRIAVLASLSLLFLSVSAVLLIHSRQRLKSPMGMFYESCSELQNDLIHVREVNHRE